MNPVLSPSDSLEARLRAAAPVLRPPRADRVDAACARACAAPAPSPLREPGTFLRPLLRLAACLALLVGLALLMRPERPAPGAAPLALPAVTSFSALADLMRDHELATALATEADRLEADLAGLTAVLNDRTLSILF